jgi:hypothetical protein
MNRNICLLLLSGVTFIFNLQAQAQKAPIQFRSKPAALSEEQTKVIIKKYNFYARPDNLQSKGFKNDFVLQKNGQVVFDRASGLMWQRETSPKFILFGKVSDSRKGEIENAYDNIQRLNEQKFAGFSDWRIPTLEEAMSLTDPDNCIDPIFPKTGAMWTCDSHDKRKDLGWVVMYGTRDYGCSGCFLGDRENGPYQGRAVRTADVQLNVNLIVDNMGEMVWGAFVEYAVPHNDMLSTVTLTVNGIDITDHCYLSSRNRLITPAIVMTVNNKSLTVAAEVKTVNGLSKKVEHTFVITDEHINTFFNIVDQMKEPLGLIEEFVKNELPDDLPGDPIFKPSATFALTVLQSMHHFNKGNKREGIETLLQEITSILTLSAPIDFAVEVSGFDAYLCKSIKGRIPDEEYEHFQNDITVWKAFKLLVYSEINMVQWVSSFDSFSMIFPEGFYPNPIPGVTDPQYQFLKDLHQATDNLNKKLDEIFSGIDNVCQGINKWISSLDN